MISKLSAHLGPGTIFAGDQPLILEFNDVSWLYTNNPDWETLSGWNTFFGTIETEFKSIVVTGNKITLSGGKNLTLKESCFAGSDLLYIIDNGGIITNLGRLSFVCLQMTSAILRGVTQSLGNAFQDCISLTNVELPKLETVTGGDGFLFSGCTALSDVQLPMLSSIDGSANFENCTNLTNLYLPLCTVLGNTPLSNNNFFGITGQTISLTVTPELLTCAFGDPDGDIPYLVSNNTVTIQIPTEILSFTPSSATYSGSTMSLTGKGFYGINSVKLGGGRVATYSINSFTSITLTTGTVSSGSVSVSGLYGSASKSGFEWDTTTKFDFVASAQNVDINLNTWIDLSSYQKDLTLKPGTLLDTPYSVLFDGSSNCNATSDVMNVNYTNGFTIEAWLNFSSFGNANYIMQFLNTSYPNTNQTLNFNSTGTDLQIWSLGSVDFNTVLPTNRFIKAVITYDSSNNETKTYIDGELTNTGTLSLGSYKRTIGQLSVGNVNSLQSMRMGKLSFLNYVQDATTILNNYNLEKDTYEETLGSFVFDSSSSQYLSSESSDYIIGTQAFTLESFVKTSTQSGYDGIISMTTQEFLEGPAINIYNGFFDFLIPGYQYNSYTASNDEWHHVAISRQLGTSSFFVDGKLVQQVSDNNNYTPESLVIGRYYTDLNDHYIDGIISNPRVTIGESLYTSDFGVSTPLSKSVNTKLLLLDYFNNKLGDSSGLTNSTLSPNGIGWTSSVPTAIGPFVVDSLQLYLDASTYPGSGTNWSDISGNNRNFTLTPGYVTYNSGNGGHFIFDGSHSISSNGSYAISMTNGFTMEVVCQVSAGGSNGVFTFNGSDYINIQTYGTYLRWEVDAGQSINSIPGLTPNTWVHITCTYDGNSNSNSSGTCKVYINGVLNNSSSRTSSRQYNSTPGLQYSPFVLGLHDGYLTGKIALARFYNKALSDPEITQNFNFTKSRFGL